MQRWEHYSVFFTQSPSFLEHQRLMKSSKGKDNGSSLFSLNEIPCDNQIRTLLDPVTASKIFGAFQRVYQWLKKQGVLKRFRYKGWRNFNSFRWDRIFFFKED